MSQSPATNLHPAAAPEAPEELGFDLPPPRKSSRIVVLLGLVVVAGGATAYGLWKHKSNHEQIESTIPKSEQITVEVITPKPVDYGNSVTLPGTARALEETQVYPRASGYVAKWLVDIGDPVTEGQLLATIETPELDAQLAQARAQLASAQAAVTQANAQSVYSKQSTARYEKLEEQKLVAKAQVEQTQAQAATDTAAVQANKSTVNAQEANVRRLSDLRAFQNVTAPFTGTITMRNIERGQLVSEGTGSPMFTLVAFDPIRVYIDAPQGVAMAVKPGSKATVTVREIPGRKFDATVARTAGALDPNLHTMTVEVRVPNPDHTLLPGMYVQVALDVAVTRPVVEIPATALYQDSNGLRVATLGAGDAVHFEPITIERDTGATLQVSTGLTPQSRVLRIAVPTLAEGTVVKIAPPSAPPPGSGSAAGSGSTAAPGSAAK